MRERCNNKNCNSYKWYGEKGIKVEWNTVTDFIKDMKDDYQKHIEKYGENNTSIDRIDRNKNYCKQNCRWVTWKEQAKNKTKRKGEAIEYAGQVKQIKEWCELLGIKYATFKYRTQIMKLSTEEAFDVPIGLAQKKQMV